MPRGKVTELAPEAVQEIRQLSFREASRKSHVTLLSKGNLVLSK